MKKTAIAKVQVILPDDPRQRLAAIAREIKAGIEDHLQVLRDAWERGKPFAVEVGLLLIEAEETRQGPKARLASVGRGQLLRREGGAKVHADRQAQRRPSTDRSGDNERCARACAFD